MKTKREITAREYEEVASRLTDAINGNTYFSDSISGEGWRFTPSVMVYWHTDTLGIGRKGDADGKTGVDMVGVPHVRRGG